MATRVSTEIGRRPGRPKAGLAEDVPRKLKNAARTNFGTYGFEGASVARIAKDAGVAPTALYHHFGTKEALWEQVFLDDLDAAYSRIEELITSRPTLVEALNYFFAQRTHIPAGFNGAREFLIRCAADMRAFPELEKYREHRSTAQIRVFRSLTDLGVQSGEIHPTRDLDVVTELLRTLVMGRLWEGYTHPDQADQRAETLGLILPEILGVLARPEVSREVRPSRQAS
jgi:AcrR family transcriptional regulator